MFVAFFLGVILTILGLTLLLVGDVRLGRRRIKKASARKLGVFLVCFFPVVLIERVLLTKFDTDEQLDPLIVHCSLGGLWLLVGLIWILMIAKLPGRKKRPTEETIGQPVGSDEGPWIAPPGAKDAGKGPRNPFEI
jgi:hypothetical protein